MAIIETEYDESAKNQETSVQTATTETLFTTSILFINIS